ncbi:MAG: hypothetical protein ACM3SP_12175 [Chloroflexota bacterium]
MGSCQHRTLELLPVRKRTLRCRHCHLTLDGAELGEGYCPECFDRFGARRYDFEEIEIRDASVTYRCEECGAVVKCP